MPAAHGGGQIKTAWSAACRSAGLPGTWREWTDSHGQLRRRFVPELHPHDLRHTAATWHYALHRDLLRLQAFGGWSSVGQVQVYAHLLPEAYVAEAAEWLGLEQERTEERRRA